MNRIRFLLTSCAIAIVSSPVLAQAPATPDSDRVRRGWEYGYGHMWGGGPMWRDGWGFGWHPGMIIGPIILALILIGFVAVIVSLVRWFTHAHDGRARYESGRTSGAMAILEERFARGEIDKAAFEDMRRTLGR